jgi:hypothetical protein
MLFDGGMGDRNSLFIRYSGDGHAGGLGRLLCCVHAGRSIGADECPQHQHDSKTDERDDDQDGRLSGSWELSFAWIIKSKIELDRGAKITAITRII